MPDSHRGVQHMSETHMTVSLTDRLFFPLALNHVGSITNSVSSCLLRDTGVP